MVDSSVGGVLLVTIRWSCPRGEGITIPANPVSVSHQLTFITAHPVNTWVLWLLAGGRLNGCQNAPAASTPASIPSLLCFITVGPQASTGNGGGRRMHRTV